ncbi:MAG TPA: tRNA 2-thiouridine(34) synthase MnmA [Candidatus Paceibacterota bacterium]|nr:tRNA 2-thiouridine(34) synthase MnmA [Candidatus Paceibacterota bacterium]
MSKQQKKVFVGISGGVDSSVSAHLLKKAGYEVHGVFIKTWAPDWVPCTWVDEKRDAMRVCAALGIPFHFLDCEAEYKTAVADHMIAEYRAGRTPNPDVLCNRIIKFGSFLQYALAQGADYIATGHYAQVKKEDGYQLLKGADAAKDQSYFLWMLTQADLAHTLFPIGHLQKSEVRRIAAKANLFTAEKKDSQGICFLGEVDMKDFLRHYITPRQGAVVDTSGNVIGTHDGVWFVTLGERHGFTVTVRADAGPYYVVKKDIDKNTITVASHYIPESELVSEIILKNINQIIPWEAGKRYQAQLRYHGELVSCTISGEKIIFEKPVLATPAQSLVLYDGNTCVGGGVII